MKSRDASGGNDLVQSKLNEFFWEWVCLPEAQKVIVQVVQSAKTDSLKEASAPSHQFSKTGRTAPSPPGSPHQRHLANSLSVSTDGSGSEWSSAVRSEPTSPTSIASSRSGLASVSTAAGVPSAAGLSPALSSAAKDETTKADAAEEHRDVPLGTAKVIPRFWWPKRSRPTEVLSPETRAAIHSHFVKQNIKEIRTAQQLEPIVTDVFGLSRYFVVPILHKLKVFYDMVDDTASSKDRLLEPSPEPITEDMLCSWAECRIQPDDPVLSFFHVVKKDHNNWIERNDFQIFLTAVLLLHPGLDFLRETTEFQDRYAETVISRIFFSHDRKDIGRIYMPSLRRYKPSVIDTWKQLAEHDDIKMVRDYFSYEHFYVIYCTFWELDSDHDFLLDKDDLLKYDGHTLSRRAVDRIFSEVPSKFTSGVPGKMGYDDFIRFLLCDQNRQTDRSIEYWFHLFDLDGDGLIRDHEMKYFYEEQVQRMECLNYETINFPDILCQMNDMIWPNREGVFSLQDIKRRRKVAGTFFSFLSSLNKFLNFEHRDPFLAKQELLDSPNSSDWDRWCSNEYLRLAMEEGNDEDENTMQGDDS